MPLESTSTPARLVGLDLARACAAQADVKQASDLTILDLRGISQLADFFVIGSGTSLPHLKALRDEIVKGLTESHGERPNNRDGVAESQWMVLDYIDVVVHIFHEDLRPKYALEDLWGTRLVWIGRLASLFLRRRRKSRRRSKDCALRRRQYGD